MSEVKNFEKNLTQLRSKKLLLGMLRVVRTAVLEWRETLRATW